MSTRVTRNSGAFDALLPDELDPAIAPVEPELVL
jgi:hypothetical protein